MTTATIEEMRAEAEAEAESLEQAFTKHFKADRAATWRLAWDGANMLDGELEALRLLWVVQDPIAAHNAYDETMSAHIESLVKSHIDNGTTPPNF